MESRRGNLKSAAGTARQQRFPAALDPASAPLDQRTRADFMSFALEYSKLLNYYDTTNQPVSNWWTFFARDLSFLLARIATTDFQGDHFKAWALQNAVKEGRESTKEILKAIYQMAKQIDDWHSWAADIAVKEGQDNQLRMTLQSIIESDLRRNLGSHIESILRELPAPSGGETWSAFWGRREARLHPIWRITQSQGGPDTMARYDEPMDGLLAILRTFHLANHKLHDVAKQYLEEFLSKHSNHPPHTALYIAFAKLLELLRDKINAVTDRHLDFYYRDVLKLSERGSTPDVAHVAFELAPTINGYMLPAGTRLSAGKDLAGKPIEYATNQDLFINRARITRLQALYMAKDRFATLARDPDRALSIFALPQVNSEDGLGEPLKTPAEGWPTFGVNEATIDGASLALPHAELGFIVASPLLLLQEGERNVTITITFAGDGTLEAALQTYQSTAADILDLPVKIESLLADALLVYLSGEKGWYPVTNASFRRHPVVGTTLEIEFTLKPTDPPVMPNPAIAPAADAGQWPLFKLALNPNARVYAYPFFKDLDIETIELRAGVRGLQKIQLRNELGPLDAAQPFPVFGPVPSQGSYLLLGHRELAVKNVNHATIVMTWFNLPKPPANLASYYAGYGLGIHDDSFKVRLSIFNDGKWAIPAGGRDLFPLFARDYDLSTGLLPTTVIASDVPTILPQSSEPPNPQPLSETEAPRGSIRLELVEPAFGFAHQVFPAIMAEAATSNARAGKNASSKALPNPPLSPIAKALALDYEASDALVLRHPFPESQPARFYSIYPFGYLSHPGRPTSMFARIEEQGHLYLGISEAGPRQSLTLLFNIRDTGFSPVPSLRSHHDELVEPIRWRYLAGHEWKDFPAWLMISDSTMGLTRSGVIQLSLPEDIATDSSLMPGGSCWIEAAANQVAGVYWSRVVSIDTQAVTATRVCDTHSELVSAVLPPNTISQLSEKRPQIKTVQQPFATSEGRSRENAAEFRTRVSERLRHKDRAIQSFDYERMILDRFPEVGQVKCVGYNNSRHFPGTVPVSPGMLYLVVAPRLENNSNREPRLPQFVLERIRDFVCSHTSPFVKDIHIINPVYETLKIFTNVEFSAEGDGAYYTDDLSAAISHYLESWRSQPGKALPIGSGQIQGYQLSLFIQQQPYVKRIRSLAMLHTFQTETGYVSNWLSAEQRAWASAPWAVLIPAARHGVVAMDPDKKDEIDEGIRNLTVGGDLVMSPGMEEEKKEDGTEMRYFLVIPRHSEHGRV